MTNLTIAAADVRVVKIFEAYTWPLAEAISEGQAVRLVTSTGKGTKANASSAAEAMQIGVLVSQDGAATAGTIVRRGILDVGADVLTALDYGALIYLSDTDGTLADTPGTVPVTVGRVIPGWAYSTADKLLLVETPNGSIPASTINGAALATVADDNVIGGVPVVHRVLLASGANADHDVVLTHKTRVIDAWVVMKGAGTAGCTVTVKNGATAISDAFSTASAGDKDIVRAGEIDDAQQEIAAAGTLRISTASSGANFPGAEAYVMGLRVA